MAALYLEIKQLLIRAEQCKEQLRGMKWEVGGRVFTYVGVHKASCLVLLGDQLHAQSYSYCMN